MLVSSLPDYCLFQEIRQMLVSVLPGFLKLVKIRHESLARKPATKACRESLPGISTRLADSRAGVACLFTTKNILHGIFSWCYNIRVIFVRKRYENKEDGNELGSGLSFSPKTPETLSFFFFAHF